MFKGMRLKQFQSSVLYPMVFFLLLSSMLWRAISYLRDVSSVPWSCLLALFLQAAAYKYIGRSAGRLITGQVALGETRRTALLTGAVARVTQRALLHAAQAKLHGFKTSDAIVILKAFDATPWRVSFGKLSTRVDRHARYLVPQDNGKWTTVPATEFEQRFPGRALPGRGTLELLGQTCGVAAVRSDGTVDSFGIPIPPMFLQNGKASTIFAAVDHSVPFLSVEQICKLSEEIPYVFVSAVPDAAKPNIRMLGYCHNVFQGYKNIFENSIQMCLVHGEHRVMTTAIAEDSLVGDVHAHTVVHQSASHHAAVASGIQAVIESDFEWNTIDLPLPEWREHTERMLWFTLGADTRGAADAAGAAASEMKVPSLANLSRPRFLHPHVHGPLFIVIPKLRKFHRVALVRSSFGLNVRLLTLGVRYCCLSTRQGGSISCSFSHSFWPLCANR